MGGVTRMLYTQRKAVEAMPAPWAAVHRVLWRLYWPLSRFGAARYVWGQYRKTWPS